MPYTFGELKAELRTRLFPQGESPNLRKDHDQRFVDALIDLQTYVPCLQAENTLIIPHCDTFYNCGLTVLNGVRGLITGLSVIDKVDPVTQVESATGEDDWCAEVKYYEVDYCHVEAFLKLSAAMGCCLSLPLFFGLDPCLCPAANIPVPTDEGVAAGLPSLPLGYHYPQTSTDGSVRARIGVWAKSHGRIYIAPWIQSTESVVLFWNGLKRDWASADAVDPDPLLKRAVEFYLLKEHAAKWDRSDEDYARFATEYGLARQDLWHQCREETRARTTCEASGADAARGMSSAAVGTLYYNDEQQATASCPPGQTGDPKTVTVDAGTIGSTISKADANQKATDQAIALANSLLVCEPVAQRFGNTPQPYTARCAQEEDAPVPDGPAVTVVIPANTYFAATQAAADQRALEQAQADAEAALDCTWHNRAVSYTYTCPNNPLLTLTKAIPAAQPQYDSKVSQADADQKASNAAREYAINNLDCGLEMFGNVERSSTYRMPVGCGATRCCVQVTVIVAANAFHGATQAVANQYADTYAASLANQTARNYCLIGKCGMWDVYYPSGQVGGGTRC